MDWKQLGMQMTNAGATFIGSSINRAIGNRQNRKAWLKNLPHQMAYEKEMADYQQRLALDLWDKTNAEAQMKHLEAAGLNPGLMYGQSGPGGTTAGAGKGSQPAGPSMADGGMGIDILSAKIAMEQAKNIEADTKLKEAQANKTAGADTEAVLAGIEKMKQETRNMELQQSVLTYETQLKEIETEIAKKTQPEIVKQAKLSSEKLAGETMQALNEGKIKESTASEIIYQAKLTSIEKALNISLQKANITYTEEQTKKVSAEIVKMQAEVKQGWERLSIQEQEMLVKKLVGEFQTNDAAHIKQYTEILNDLTRSYADWGGTAAKLLDAAIPF